MTSHFRDGRSALRHIAPARQFLIAALSSVLTIATLAAAQDAAVETAPQQDVQDQAAQHRDADRPAARPARSQNVRDFGPADSTAIIPAEAINLRQVFEQLGRDAAQWYQHVQTLSNPFFEGRCPGTRGHELAVEYLEFYFRQYGLEPAFVPDGQEQLGGAIAMATSYQQPFEFRAPNPLVDVDTAKMFIGDRALQRGPEFEVLGNSGSGSVTGPIAFVGYGIERGRNDYSSFDEDTSLEGRVALLLRYEPLDHEGKSQWAARRFSSASAITSKVEAVLKRHPAAIMLVNPPECADGATGLETPESSAAFGASAAAPIVHISTDIAQELIKKADGEGRDLLEWRRLADEGEVRTVLLNDNIKVRIDTAVSRIDSASGSNVAGVLPGKGALADEWIVIGGHFDHIGYGHFGSGAGDAGVGHVHPGADDNASGTAGVLMLAKNLTQRYEKEGENVSRRSIMFMAFSAEESGLHGSRAFTDHPSIPMDDVTLMINMDMVGRLRNNQLSVSGTGTAEEFDEMLPDIFAASDLDIQSIETGTGPSDHSNFYRAEVPVLFLFTGVHEDYHKPADEGWTVNPAGAMKVLNLAETLAWEVAHREAPLTYKEAAAGGGRDRGYARVRLGIRPDMAATEGIVVQEVSEGTSAADAGIEPGDILLEWNGTGLMSMGDLMESLRSHEPGDVVELKIKRGEDELTIPVTLKASEDGG